jgi:hypothetical protein
MHYALHDPETGGWFYHLSPRTGLGTNAELRIDGEPARSTPAGCHWYRTETAASVAEWSGDGPLRAVGYRLRDASAASSAYPLDLSIEEYHERTDDLDYAPESALYEVVTIEGERVSETVDLSTLLRLDGAPPVDHEGTWKATLPSELAYRTEYLHLFPGTLHGFKEAVQTRLESLPGVDTVYENRDRRGLAHPGLLDVTVKVPYRPAKVEHRPALNRNGSRSRSRPGRDVELTYRTVVTVVSPREISGASLAVAVVEWDQRMEGAVDLVTRAGEIIACGHCEGTGVAGTRATITHGRRAGDVHFGQGTSPDAR